MNPKTGGVPRKIKDSGEIDEEMVEFYKKHAPKGPVQDPRMLPIDWRNPMGVKNGTDPGKSAG